MRPRRKNCNILYLNGPFWIHIAGADGYRLGIFVEWPNTVLPFPFHLSLTSLLSSIFDSYPKTIPSAALSQSTSLPLPDFLHLYRVSELRAKNIYSNPIPGGWLALVIYVPSLGITVITDRYLIPW